MTPSGEDETPDGTDTQRKRNGTRRLRLWVAWICLDEGRIDFETCVMTGTCGLNVPFASLARLYRIFVLSHDGQKIVEDFAHTWNN